MQTAKASTNATNTAMVKRVGQRLANAVETYLRNNGMSSEINNFKWEFNLVQDKSVNAFCMPGGKIVVYEGLLPVTQNEASLAVVLGHEIAHAVAKHSAEQMSKQMRQQYGTQIGSGVLSALGVGSDVTSMASSVAGQLFSFKNLKYSRDNESEADHMGLIFAAMAGYDPNVAVSFWKRMAAQGSSSSSDLFSDHPSDSKRIAAIQNEMPEALKYYQASGYSSNGTTKSVSKTKGTSRRR
jgi:predicted Zn-dependent protease